MTALMSTSIIAASTCLQQIPLVQTAVRVILVFCLRFEGQHCC